MIVVTVSLAILMAMIGFSTIGDCMYNRCKKSVPITFLSICLVLSVWSICSIETPFKHSDYIICDVQECVSSNDAGIVQQIVWTEDRETRTLNVNEYFKRSFKVGDKVTVIAHPAAWYYGIHWAAQREFVAGEVKPD